jgi:4-hydroxy-3-methylbut-2-enyl diphosphate reductase
MSEIICAESAGFCFGVSRSVEMAEKALATGKAIYCLGELIHNRDEVRRLQDMGLIVIDSADELPKGATVIIRSHGVGRAVYEQLRKLGAEIIDATCPKVERIHAIARMAEKEGRTLLIIGAASHPEVQGIQGWCDNSMVFEDDAALSEFAESPQYDPNMAVTAVFQTTQTEEILKNSKFFLKKLYTNCKIFDTICSATQARQTEALDLASKCGAVIVVGGKHSANSRHLYELCSQRCGQVCFVESAQELNSRLLASYDAIGITAGASVPAWIIKEVKQKMCDEIVKETAVEPEKSFAELLEDSIKTIYNGDTVKGVVAAITPTEISVDLGTKHSGYIPVDDFSDDPSAKIEDLVHVGDTVEACVVRVNDVEGTVMLSKKRLDAVKTWTDIEAAAEAGTIVEGVVTEENKGGIVVSVKGVRVFVPASQSGLPKDAEMSQLLKQKVRLKITEVNKARRRVVGSIRAVAAKERRERAEKIWNEIEVGKRYDGVVKSLTSYGAFVDIGGVDGMVHVSELSWKRIGKPADVVSVGDPISVYVIGFDKENHKISLGYKDPNGNPWTVFTNTCSVGSVVPVKIVKLMTFGAFAEVVPGVDGLIHISQIANRRIGKPEEVLTVGETVDAKIIAVDEEKHKVSLSIRALSEPEPAPVVEEEHVYERPAAREDALVYEVSETGETTGVAPEAEETEE